MPFFKLALVDDQGTVLEDLLIASPSEWGGYEDEELIERLTNEMLAWDALDDFKNFSGEVKEMIKRHVKGK